MQFYFPHHAFEEGNHSYHSTCRILEESQTVFGGLSFNVICGTDTSIVSARWQPYYPQSRIQRGSPIEFNIETSPDYIDLSKCYMKFKLKITKAYGADIDDKKVITINNFLHSMIKQMSIKLNNTLVTQQNDTYAYKSQLPQG